MGLFDAIASDFKRRRDLMGSGKQSKTKDQEKSQDTGYEKAPPKEFPLVNAKGETTPESMHKGYLKSFGEYLKAQGMSMPNYVKTQDVTAYLKTRTREKKKGGTKMAKKHIMELPTNVPRMMAGANLMNPKKADLDKDGKLNSYEKARGRAIEKSMNEKKKTRGA